MRLLPRRVSEQERVDAFERTMAPHYREAEVEARWGPLRTFNVECLRGIMHTPEYVALMAEHQRQFDEWWPQQPWADGLVRAGRDNT